jgi:hypothetical protein
MGSNNTSPVIRIGDVQSYLAIGRFIRQARQASAMAMRACMDNSFHRTDTLLLWRRYIGLGR